MSLRVLEQLRDELISAGLVSNTAEFCISWLGKSECYIRTLRHSRLDASADALNTCASKLGYYAKQLEHSKSAQHVCWGELMRKHKMLCEQALEAQAKAKWMQPDRMVC